MAAVERTKYLDTSEVQRLRLVAEARAVLDLQKGRTTGVLSWAVVDAALQTGLRVSELAKLTVGDVDLRRGALRVWRHKRRDRKQETTAIAKDLHTHLRDFIEWKRLLGHPTGPTAPLFVGKRGPLTPHGLQQIWKQTIVRAGLPKELSIHSARHTLAVHLLRKTRNLRMVQKQLGHANPATTANMYADVSFEDMQEGLDGLYRGAADGPGRKE